MANNGTDMTSRAGRAAVLLAVGPGELELDRLAELARTLDHHFPSLSCLVLVDDARRPDDLVSALPPALQPITRVFPNPRRGHELGWREGLNVGIWTGLRHLSLDGEWDYILKLDTDSLVIAPPHDGISNFFLARPSVGLIGTWRTSPNGREGDWRANSPVVSLLAKRIAVFRDHVTQRRRILLRFGHRSKRQRLIFAAALARGYEPGEHCQGGGYALAGATLKALAAARMFNDVNLWSNFPITEDVALAVCVRAIGHELASANSPGEPFGVQYAGLPFSPTELRSRGYSVIHSIKSDPQFPEKIVREFFANTRKTD